MAGRCLTVPLLLAVFWLIAPGGWAAPKEKANSPARDDFTTDFAKQIIRQSKVAEMKGMLNTAVAPCDDFYGYACGNWHRHNPAQLFRDIMTDTFQVIAKGFDRRLQRLLQSEETNSKLEEKLQGFYKSCMQVRNDEYLYKRDMQSIYSEYGEFPFLAGDRWNGSSFGHWWRKVAEIQRKYSTEIILAVNIMADVKNHTVNRIYITPPNDEQSIHALNILEDAALTSQMEHCLSTSRHLAKKTAKQINKLQRELWSAQASESTSLIDELKLYNLTELEEKYIEHLNLTEFLSLVLGADNVPDKVYIYNEGYLTNTLDTLQKTSNETIVNYLLWELLEPYCVNQKPSEMSNYCTDQTKKHFGKLTDHLIYERYRSPQAEEEVHSVWQQIRAIFRQELNGDKLDWISNRTRQLAIEKLDRMGLHINAYDNENFDELYGTVPINRNNFVQNVQELLKAQAVRNLKRLHNTAASLEDIETLSFTPAYNIQENNITIPVALLQPRYFWHADYPQALKYGTLGYLLAHEMIHGFDDEGRTYDAEGNLAPWWDEKSRYEFEEKRKCFQAQYHAYKYNGAQLPESVEQSENIADNAGIKLAYKAYQRWLAEQPPEVLLQETLPGLDLNNLQLFFVSFAQQWCDDVQSLFKTSVVEADNHAPSKYRVIGPLSNFQEFSWVYKCSQQAPMDPEFKCAVY